MASYSVEEFIGDGALKRLIPTLVAAGRDDVPTLKMMNSADMDRLGFTKSQKDAFEIRSFLHDRSLMEYAGSLETSKKPLAELLMMISTGLYAHIGIRRRDVARFMEPARTCRPTSSQTCILPEKKRSSSSTSRKIYEDQRYVKLMDIDDSRFSSRSHTGQSIGIDIKNGRVVKGIVASEPAEARLCGCIQPPQTVFEVAPYSLIENILVQRLTADYKMGQHCFTTLSSPMKSSNLWLHKPVILLCLRRPGCVMCRAEAHRLYARKPIFDALGFQMIAVLHEYIESEVKAFWPRFWGGAVVFDPQMDFFKALGGGDLPREKFFTGFLLNPRAITNFKRARATGIPHNFVGDGETKGGLFIISYGKHGVAYQFVERNFGDWAPIDEVVEVCIQLQELHSKKGGQDRG